VPAGTWKDLTANVNLLAANLTNQVRAIAEVATAVTKGDLTRSIQVDARGEVSELKDNINAMIGNLKVTTERNTEQDWLQDQPREVQRHDADVSATCVPEGHMLLESSHRWSARSRASCTVFANEAGRPYLRQLASTRIRRTPPSPRRFRLIGEGHRRPVCPLTARRTPARGKFPAEPGPIAPAGHRGRAKNVLPCRCSL
jgi:HAMP domain-containing protein